MVQVRAHQPVNTDGSINLEAWLDHVQNLVPGLDRQGLLEACEFARESEQRAIAAQNSWAEGTSSFQTGLEIAEIPGAGRAKQGGRRAQRAPVQQ